MYRVETYRLKDLLRIWLEDTRNPRELESSSQTSSTGEYRDVRFDSGDDDLGVRPELVSVVIEHYLNERKQVEHSLVSCCPGGLGLLFIWHVAD